MPTAADGKRAGARPGGNTVIPLARGGRAGDVAPVGEARVSLASEAVGDEQAEGYPPSVG